MSMRGGILVRKPNCDLSDAERTVVALRGSEGKRLTYGSAARR